MRKCNAIKAAVCFETNSPVELHYPRLACNKIISDWLSKSFIVHATHRYIHITTSLPEAVFHAPTFQKVWRTVMTEKAITSSTDGLKKDTDIYLKNTRCEYLEQIQLVFVENIPLSF